MVNETELKLLLRLASGRVKALLQCPICDKRLARLDMHLTAVHKLSGTELDTVMNTAKRQCILDKLRDLRRSVPDPPLASDLDTVKCGGVIDSTDPHSNPGEEGLFSSQCSSTALPGHVSPRQVTQPAASGSTQASLDGTSISTPSPKGRAPTTEKDFHLSLVYHVLGDFEDFSLRSQPTEKDRENAHLRRSHALRFVMYMARNDPNQRFKNFKFLYDMERIRR